MIVCGVKSFTHNGHKVHEIDLKCHSCSSQFVLTAAHDCEAEDHHDENDDTCESLPLINGCDDEEDAGGIVTADSGGGLVGFSTTTNSVSVETSGLEWLTDGEISLVNMII